MNIKSALRDLLSVPYGMISILIIGLLRSSPKEETHSLGRSPICLFFLGRKPGCEGFIQTGAFYNLKALYNNPRAGGASNLRTLEAIAPSNFRTLKPVSEARAQKRLQSFLSLQSFSCQYLSP